MQRFESFHHGGLRFVTALAMMACIGAVSQPARAGDSSNKSDSRRGRNFYQGSRKILGKVGWKGAAVGTAAGVLTFLNRIPATMAETNSTNQITSKVVEQKVNTLLQTATTHGPTIARNAIHNATSLIDKGADQLPNVTQQIIQLTKQPPSQTIHQGANLLGNATDQLVNHGPAIIHNLVNNIHIPGLF